MRFLFIVFTLFLFQHCSFDDKSGIWKSENKIKKKINDQDSGFEKLTTTQEKFDKIIPFKPSIKIDISEPIKNSSWNDVFFKNSNNYINFKYKDINKLIFKSKRLSKFDLNKYQLIDDKNVITSDKKGNLIIYSLNKKQILTKFNFYKNRFKKINKVLNLIVEDDIIYVSDNLGYLYSYNFKKNQILWAKNYKIPFRSNLKISDNKIIAANQNNDLLFFNKLNGDVIKLIPTEETIIKNKFVNNLSINDDSILFLNTYGSLYSIEKKTLRIVWFLNLNRSLDLNPSNLFSGNELISYRDKIAISTNDTTYFLDKNNGAIIFKKNFSSKVKPLIDNNYYFTITQNNLMICMSLISGEIIYSYNIYQQVKDYLKNINVKIEYNMFAIANSKIFIFLNNSNLLKFSLNGNLENIIKLPTKTKSLPIFFDELILFIDRKSQITILN